MDHTDSHFNGLFGTVNGNFLSPYENFARSGPVQTVKHVHQRTLPRAVLTQNGMDLAFMDRQIDMVIGCEIAEFFYDVLHLDRYGFLIHMAYLSHESSSYLS